MPNRFAPSLSFYFQNHPPSWDAESLKAIFGFYGKVAHVFLSKKPNIKGKQYGFVDFLNVADVETLKYKLENVWIGTYKLHVKPAHQPATKHNNYTSKPRQIPPPTSLRDRGHTKQHRNNPKPSSEGRHFSKPPYGPRILKVSARQGDLDKLQLCAVGTLHDPSQLPSVEEQLNAMGVNNVRLTPMGGNLVLLEFPSMAEMKDFLEDDNRDFGCIFDWISPWKPKDVSRKRLVWVRCMGLPLHIWNEDAFRMIGNSVGNFIAIDESTGAKSRLDMARILVSTNIGEFIRCSHSIQVEDDQFRVEIVEDLAGDTLFIQSDFKVPDYGKNMPNAAWTTNLEQSASTSAAQEHPTSKSAEPVQCQAEVANLNSVTLHDDIQMEGHYLGRLNGADRDILVSVGGERERLSGTGLDWMGDLGSNVAEIQIGVSFDKLSGQSNQLAPDWCDRASLHISSVDKVSDTFGSGQEFVNGPSIQQTPNPRLSGPNGSEHHEVSQLEPCHVKLGPQSGLCLIKKPHKSNRVQDQTESPKAASDRSMDHESFENSLNFQEQRVRRQNKKSKRKRRLKIISSLNRPLFNQIQRLGFGQRLRRRKIKKLTADGVLVSDHSTSQNDRCILENNRRVRLERGEDVQIDIEIGPSSPATAEALRCWEAGSSLGFFGNCDKEKMLQIFKERLRSNKADLGDEALR